MRELERLERQNAILFALIVPPAVLALMAVYVIALLERVLS